MVHLQVKDCKGNLNVHSKCIYGAKTILVSSDLCIMGCTVYEQTIKRTELCICLILYEICINFIAHMFFFSQ